MISILLAAQLVTSALPLSPAEAAQVMARLDSPANFAHRFVCTDCDGPRAVIARSSPTAGPFGEFAPFPPTRRLDGTLLSQPPWILRAYVGRRPDKRLDRGQHLPPTIGRGIAANAALQSRGSMAGGANTGPRWDR